MTEDVELLRRYVRDRSQAAFAELVHRRIDFVYAVALRHVGGDAHLAEDVAQLVFADLARKAAELSTRTVLSGWLYRSAQFAAGDAVRSERRRREREQESVIMNEIFSNQEAKLDGDKLRPALDEVLGELAEEDRDAVALRFFEQRSFADIARVLQVSEDAARKRVVRALDQLHGLLARRGVHSTTVALSLALAASPGVAAPNGLATAIASAAAGKLAMAGAGTAGAAGVFGSIAFAVVAAVVGVGALGVSTRAANRVQEVRAETAAVIGQSDRVKQQLGVMEGRLAAAEKRQQTADADIGRLLKEIREAPPTLGLPPEGAAGVAFVIDTSGSMRDASSSKLWPAVLRSIGHALAAYPDARFFTVFDADGRCIFGDQGGWFPSSIAALPRLSQALEDYKIFSSSSPVPGICSVLRVLPERRETGMPRLHVCIIGDELTDQPEPVLRRLDELNPRDAAGNRAATISAVQLSTTVRADGTHAPTGEKFNAAMEAVTKAHAGSFTLLPRSELE